MSAPQHFLYLLDISTYKESDGEFQEVTVALKVGITNNPSRRLLEIQSGTPFKVKPIRILKGNKETCRYCEKNIKQMCKGYKLSERLFKSGYQETFDIMYYDWLMQLYDRLAQSGMIEINIQENTL